MPIATTTSPAKVEFHLEDFTGPLDLLLALIAKNKMSILDIEILTLIDQYLEVVGDVEAENLDGTSEFISMASHLVRMKSVLLLPRSEEGERLREELTGMLVEYNECKRIAALLREMQKGVFIAVRQPQPCEHDTAYRRAHDPAELADAYILGAQRRKRRSAPRREQFDDLVAAPFVSVSGRVIHVLRGLVTGRVLALRQLFSRRHSRGETVATFLAVLELIRGGRIRVDDAGALRLKKGHARHQ